MASRNKTGLFIPDERGIGGAMELAAEYRHFFGSSGRVQPKAAAGGYEPALPTAQKLSSQRATKYAMCDTTAHDHLVRLTHMYRRVHAISAGSHAQRQHRQQQHEQGTLRPGSATTHLCPWLPQPRPRGMEQIKRPATAPDRLPSSSQQQQQQQQPDWQLLKAAAHPEPQPPVQPVQLPPSRFFLGPNLLPSVQHRLFKSALMGDILQRQLYKAADIRQLCVQYIQSNPAEHRNLLRQVVLEVLQELDIQPNGSPAIPAC